MTILPFARPEPKPIDWIDLDIPPDIERRTIRVLVFTECPSDRPELSTASIKGGLVLAFKWVERGTGQEVERACK